jgi:phosphatidylserine/phosphatidylglycerophosphate/cardiolipin synthase-like enzyme
LKALEIMRDLDLIEIRFNNSLHAKVYLCKCSKTEDSFALLGSANFTWTSVNRNIEVGLLIKCHSDGGTIIHELNNWFQNKLRPGSELQKKMMLPTTPLAHIRTI